MSVMTTPAIVLAAVQYGDTSKIVKLATRDVGLQSAIAKGASRPKSKFGAALQLFSGGQAQLYLKEARELQTLGAFDVQQVRIGLVTDVARYAAASMLAELVLRFAQAEAQPEIHDLLRDALNLLETTDEIEGAGLQAGWALVAAFGFAPAFDACALDGAPLPSAGPLAFSPRDGGALCAACARGVAVAMIDGEHRTALETLLDPFSSPPTLDPRAAAAHRRLLARYVRAHLSESNAMPALDFWLNRSWAVSS